MSAKVAKQMGSVTSSAGLGGVDVSDSFSEGGVGGRIARLLADCMAGADRAPGVIAAVCLGLAAAGFVLAALRLSVDSDIHGVVSEDVPFMQLRKQFERSFPHVDDIQLLVVDADSPRRASDVADALALHLAAQPDAFRSAFVPDGGEFFARNGLLYLELDDLESLADDLAEAQPFLAEVGKDPTLRGLTGLVSRAVEAAREGHTGRLDADQLFDRVAVGLAAVRAGRPEREAWPELVADPWEGQSSARRVVLLSPVLDFERAFPAELAIERVQAAVAELASGPDVRARLTGDFVLSYEDQQALVWQVGVAGSASFLLVTLLLMLGLRSKWLLGVTVVTLVAGLGISLGFATLAIGTLNTVSVAFPVLFIGLSVDFSIHLCLRYRELRAEGQGHRQALGGTGGSVGSSVALCTLTTATGFFAFAPTEVDAVAELGVIAGTSMFVAFFLSITLLPALLSLAPEYVQARWAAPLGSVTRDEPAFAHPAWIRLLAIVVGLGALALVPRARFDPNHFNVRDPNSVGVQAAQDLLADPDRSPWTLSTLAPDYDAAGAIAARIEALDVVHRAVTPLDLVPPDQEEKLEVVDDIASFLGPPPNPAVPRPSDPAALVAALRALEAELDAFGSEGAARLRRELAALREQIESDEAPQELLVALERALLDPIHWRLERLHGALEAEPITLDDFPAAWLEYLIGVDGKLRIEILPNEDLGEPEALARFVDSVRTVTPDVAGHAINVLEVGRSIVRAFEQALVIASLAIGLLLLVLWRRVGDTLLVLGILALALVLTAAVAVLIGLPFNHADVIALPLLLGMGVDSSIHLVRRHRAEADPQGGSLSLTPHLGIATLGRMLSLGVLLMLLCTLVVLPAFLSPPPARSD